MAKRKVEYKFNPFRITGESQAGLSEAAKKRVFKKTAELVLDRVEEAMDAGKSRVDGEQFKRLSRNYAERMKGGSRRPDLELFGDLKAAQRVKREGDSLVHTVLSAQQEKADGHNQHSGKAKSWAKSVGKKGFPQRRFIPSKKEKQTYDEKLLNEIRKVIKEEKGD